MGILNELRIKAANTLVRGISVPITGNSFMGFGGQSKPWNNLIDNADYLKAFEQNPCVNAPVNIYAEASANIRFSLEDLEGNEIKPSEYNEQGKRVIELLKNPNPLQITSEWWKQNVIFQIVFGNAQMYKSFPSAFENKLEAITSLTNIWSQYMTPVGTGLFFDATKQSDIIKKWIFSFGTLKKEFEAETILHTNDTSINLSDDGVVLGASKLKSLKEPINNSYKALLARGELIESRGAQGIISSAAKDATGSAPMSPHDKKEIQEDFKDYGIQKEQYQYIISKQPLLFTRTVLPIKDLQLFEEVAISQQHISTTLRVPNDLVILYITGAKYENQKESMRQLYDAIIPASEEKVNALNVFLGTEQYGFRIKGSYSHVPVLQQDIKERSEVNRNNAIAFSKAFRDGTIKYNQYLASLNQPADPIDGDKKIWDLDDKQLQVLGINIQQDNGN